MMVSRIVCSYALVTCLLWLSPGAEAGTFHFTVTADSRDKRANFRHTLAEIRRLTGDEGLFHISVGDADSPGAGAGTPAATYSDLVDEFGLGVTWYPVVGNHEAETPADMAWIRAHYSNALPHGSPPGQPLPFIVKPGPPGCTTTTYSFEFADAHFVVLNQYYNGSSDIGSDGDVVDALYQWLKGDLQATRKSAIFVFGHEPAFPHIRHTGDSLNKYTNHRNRFWKLLEEHDVAAYVCGHTHWYSRHREAGGRLWQIDVGNAGNESACQVCSSTDGGTFLDVTVGTTEVRFDVYRGRYPAGAFALAESWSVAVGVPILTFRQARNGYTGTVDTYLVESSPSTPQGNATSGDVDADDPPGTGKAKQVLLRFDGIFGPGPNQIPLGTSIIKARLRLKTTDEGDGAALHRMLKTWNDTATWQSMVNGIQADDSEAKQTADFTTGSVSTGETVLDVTASVQAWAAGAKNDGWVFLPLGNDGWNFDSAEGGTPPELLVAIPRP